MRKSSALSIPIAALLLLGGCDALFGSGGKSEPVGGTCTKDREALSELLTQPQACAVDTDCTVTGSYCRDGVCDWDCYTDSDCGFGNTCSCEGRCIESGAPDAGPTSTGSCDRDLSVLEPMGTPLDRRCIRDEHCPLGARCDQITRKCTFDCTSDTDCASGETCSCRGECVAPGATTPPEADLTLPTVQISPSRVTVPDGYSWGNQTIGITITAADGLPTNMVPRAYVEAIGVANAFDPPPPTDPDPRDIALAPSWLVGERVVQFKEVAFSTREEQRALSWVNSASASQLQTQLGVTASQSQTIVASQPFPDLLTFSLLEFIGPAMMQAVKLESYDPAEDRPLDCAAGDRTLTLADADFSVDTTSGYTAQGSVSVGRCDTMPTGSSWRVAVSVYLEDPSQTPPKRIPLTYQIVDMGSEGVPAPVGTTYNTGMFEGTLVEQNPTAGDPLTIPVRAWQTNSTGMLLFDDAHLISGTGRIALQQFTQTFFIMLDPNGDQSQMETGTAFWNGDTNTGVPRRGTVDMVFASSPNNWRTFEYVLNRVGDPADPLSGASSELATATTCTSSADCTASEMCELSIGKCLSSVPTVSGSSSSVGHPTAQSWRDGAAFLEGANTTDELIQHVGRLLCYDYSSSFASGAEISPQELHTRGLSSDNTNGETYCGDFALPERVTTQSAVGLRTTDPSLPSSYAVVPVLSDSADALKTCIADLSRQPTPSAGTPEYQAPLWFGSPGGCVNLAQLIPAMAWLAHGDIDTNTSGYQIEHGSANLFQRLFGEWLEVHAFVAGESLQEIEAHDRLDSDTSTTDWTDIDLAGVLDSLDDGWKLLFDSSFGGVLDSIEPEQLRHPDYMLHRPDAYWSFEHQTSSTDPHVVDEVGEHHLDFQGTPQRETGSFWDDYMRLGAVDYALVANDDLKLTSNATLSFWVKLDDPPTSYTGYATVFYDYYGLIVTISQQSAAGSEQYRIGVSKWASSTYYTPWQPWAGSGITGWVHIAVTREGNLCNVYVNGNWVGGTTLSGSGPIHDTSSPTRIGNAYGDYYGFTYLLDDFAIWSAVLAPEDIQTLYQLGRGSAANSNGSAPIRTVVDQLGTPPPANPNEARSLGLPAKIVQTATREAQVVEAYAKQRHDEVYDTCYATGSSVEQQQALDRASQSMRYVELAAMRADEVYQRAGEYPCTQDRDCTVRTSSASNICGQQSICVTDAFEPYRTPPAWDDQYTAAVEELSAARAKAADALHRLSTCDNPLGIRDNDLPLYFGDLTGDNSRFFAASDYLLDGWAKPVVETARERLEDARSAWLNQRSSQIQQTLSEQDRQRRLEQLQTGMLQPVMEACGITEYTSLQVLDAFDSGALSLSTCFRAPNCKGDPDSPECLRGSLGAAVLGMKRAQLDIYLESRASAQRILEWRAAEDTFEYMAQSYAQSAQAIESYKRNAEVLRDQAGGILGGMLSSILPDEMSDLIMDTVGGCLAGGEVGCVTGFLSSDAGAAKNLETLKENLDFDLQKLQFQRELRNYADEVDRRQRAYEFGLDNMLARRADFAQAAEAFDNQLAAASRALTEARVAVDRETGRTLPDVAFHYWTDEKIDRFRVEFERARRFTYLSMLAVEYEFQQSFGLRSAILTAKNPNDLLDVLNTLDAARGTRNINGRRPAEGSEVLSLREDILQVADLDTAPTGERSDNAVARLQAVLTSPDYAVYDKDGNYVGQGIPFSLTEQGALRHRCAERLWRVSATIQGDLTSIDEPGTNVMLMKRNVFDSQWCTGLGDGSDYQEASTFGTNQFMPELTNQDVNYDYTTAMLFPWFNVRRSDFYQDQYTEGSSEELAGRGLYGDYILLFPYYGMLEPEADCSITSDPTCADPFRDLKRVEDVLIRFDYYSVDDLQY